MKLQLKKASMSRLLCSNSLTSSTKKPTDVKFFSNTAKTTEKKETNITTIIDFLEKIDMKETTKVFGILPGKIKEEEIVYESLEDIDEEEISIEKPHIKKTSSTVVIYNEMTNQEDILLYEDDGSSGSDTDM